MRDTGRVIVPTRIPQKVNQINRKYILENFNAYDYNANNVISRLVRIAVQKRSPVTLNLIVFVGPSGCSFRSTTSSGTVFVPHVCAAIYQKPSRPSSLTSASSDSAGRRRFFCKHRKSNPTTDDDAPWAAFFLLVTSYKTATPACPAEPVNNLQR